MWFAIFFEKRYNGDEVKIMISRPTYQDLIILDTLAKKVINEMKNANIPQWEEGYPAYLDFLEDFQKNGLYVYKENNLIKGSITVLPENDPSYKTINSWLKEKSLVIHRMLVDPASRNQGIAQELLNQAIKLGKANNYESLKIDTHLKNYKMRNFLKKNNFIELEYLKIIDRLAYEKVLEE